MSGSERDSSDRWPWRQLLDTVTGLHTLDALTRCLEALWSHHADIPGDIRADITTAAFEICSNIIEHAAGGRPVRMRIRSRRRPGTIDIRFSDEGDPAEVDLTAVAMPDALADRGRGLALATMCLDGLIYWRDGGENHWLLTRRLPGR